MHEALEPLARLSLPAFLVCSLLSNGLTLTPRTILAPLRNRRLVLRLLVLNFLFAPGFALLITTLIPLEHGHTAGLILLGVAPGAPFLPKLVKIAGGDLAASVAYMVILTAGTIIFLPLTIPLLVPGVDMHPWSIARPLVLLIALPLACGLMINSAFPTLSTRVAPFLGITGSCLLVLLFVLLIWLHLPAMVNVIGSGAIAVVVIYLAGTFIISWHLGGRTSEEQALLALTTSSRNFGAALIPAANCFSDPSASLVLVISAIAGLILSIITAKLARQWVAREAH